LHWLTATDRLTGEVFDIVQCNRCGLRYTSPQPELADLAAYYSQTDDSSWLGQLAGRWLRRRRARWCAAGLSPGRALEIGCGSGWLLDALRKAGWDVVGTERSEQSAALARRLGLPVRIGDRSIRDSPSSSFDLIIVWHVLEHLRDPLGTLAELRRVIRLSGRLVIAVPNIASWQARVADAHWVHLDVPRHLFHFDPTTLRTMLEATGFRIQVCHGTAFSYGLYGWWHWLATIVRNRELASPALSRVAVLPWFRPACCLDATVIVQTKRIQ
jgi:2-polyprenyl-3-methyl-5-hydroxy-6-metoxy-1,4-benzoquinol methylase